MTALCGDGLMIRLLISVDMVEGQRQLGHVALKSAAQRREDSDEDL
jgi:chorismate mutase